MIFAEAQETPTNFWSDLWNTIVTFFSDNVWAIVGFFATLLIGAVVIKIILMIIKRIMKRTNLDAVATKFIIAIVRFFLWLILFIILLSVIGVPITGITTSLSAAVLAIGVALKEFLSNVASGLILVGSKKYKEGDYIIASGVEGSVSDINFLFTTLKTPDGKQITLPNSTMTGSPVTNLGAYPTRRVTITFTVAYDTDCELVKKVVTDVMKSNGKVYLDPAPSCKLKELGESSLNFFSTCWCDKEDYWDVYYYVMENVFNEFKRNNITVPFKQVEIRNLTNEVVMPYDPKPLPAREEKKRKFRRKLTVDDFEDMTLKEFHQITREGWDRNKKEKQKKDKAEEKAKRKQEKERLKAEKAAKKKK